MLVYQVPVYICLPINSIISVQHHMPSLCHQMIVSCLQSMLGGIAIFFFSSLCISASCRHSQSLTLPYKCLQVPLYWHYRHVLNEPKPSFELDHGLINQKFLTRLEWLSSCVYKWIQLIQLLMLMLSLPYKCGIIIEMYELLQKLKAISFNICRNSLGHEEDQ